MAGECKSLLAGNSDKTERAQSLISRASEGRESPSVVVQGSSYVPYTDTYWLWFGLGWGSGGGGHCDSVGGGCGGGDCGDAGAGILVIGLIVAIIALAVSTFVSGYFTLDQGSQLSKAREGLSLAHRVFKEYPNEQSAVHQLAREMITVGRKEVRDRTLSFLWKLCLTVALGLLTAAAICGLIAIALHAWLPIIMILLIAAAGAGGGMVAFGGARICMYADSPKKPNQSLIDAAKDEVGGSWTEPPKDQGGAPPSYPVGEG